MCIRWHKTTALVVLAAYLAAITVAHVFHEHGGGRCQVCAHRPPGASQGALACCHHGHAEDEHHAATERATPATTDGWKKSSEDCQVCQFLAQKWMPAALAKARMLSGVVWQRACRRPLRLQLPPLFSWQIRGPPVVA